MAATDLAAILEAWDDVLQATPLDLVPAQLPFSHDRQPSSMVANSYYLEDAGQLSRKTMTNDQEARIDRVRVLVAKPVAFAAGRAQFRAMLDLGDDIYRYLSADGRTNGWNVEQQGHRVSQPKGTDLIIGSFDFAVDYDFNAATS